MCFESGGAGLAGFVLGPCRVVDEPEPTSFRHQSPVGVVDAQVQAELGARGEHPVGLVRALRNQVVDEDTDVGLGAVQGEAFFAAHGKGRVDAGHNALRSGFLVARRSIDLSREVEATHGLDAQGPVELRRIDGVVLDGVSGPQHLGALESRDACHHGGLHLHGERSGHAVHVDLVGGQTLGFEEKLVACLVREAHDLVFDGRAVARTHSLDLARVHGRAVRIFADQPHGLRRGARKVAVDLPQRKLAGAEAERRGLNVAGLLLEVGPVDGAAVQSRRSAGLVAKLAQAESLQRLAEQDAGWFAAAPSGILLLAAMDEAVEESSGCNDRRVSANVPAVAQAQTKHRALPGHFFQKKPGNLRLLQKQAGLRFEHFAHAHAIERLVALCARAPHGGTAAGVEQAKLDSGGVRDDAHHSPEGVDLAHKVTLRDAADRRIARHLRDEIEVEREQGRAQTHSRRRDCSLAAGMARAHNDDVELLRKCHITILSFGASFGRYSKRGRC